MRKFSLIATTVLFLSAIGYYFFFDKSEFHSRTSTTHPVPSSGLNNSNDNHQAFKPSISGSKSQEITGSNPARTAKPEPFQERTNTAGPSLDIAAMPPNALYALAKDQDAIQNMLRSDFHHLVNRLSDQYAKGQFMAVDALVSLAQNSPDEQSLHATLQALGRSGAPQAEPLLLEALQNHMGDSIAVIRIASYLPKDNGMISENAATTLFAMAQGSGVSPEVQKSLLNTVFHQGGEYGRQLIMDNHLVESLR